MQKQPQTLNLDQDILQKIPRHHKVYRYHQLHILMHDLTKSCFDFESTRPIVKIINVGLFINGCVCDHSGIFVGSNLPFLKYYFMSMRKGRKTLLICRVCMALSASHFYLALVNHGDYFIFLSRQSLLLRRHFSSRMVSSILLEI